MPVTWTQADIDTLKAAIVSGVKEVQYAGPPARKVIYHDIADMEATLARVCRSVDGTTTYRLVQINKGFR